MIAVRGHLAGVISVIEHIDRFIYYVHLRPEPSYHSNTVVGGTINIHLKNFKYHHTHSCGFGVKVCFCFWGVGG